MPTSSGLLGNRDFVRLWVGSAVSNLGSALSMIAYPLLVLSLGGDAAQAGAVISASLITLTAFHMPGRHVADLLDARAFMIGMDGVRLVIVGSIPATALLGHVSYPQLLAAAVLEGVATAFRMPASTVLLRDVVAKDHLTLALSRFQATYCTVMTVGPLLGGALFSAGPTLPFLVDAASYVVSMRLLVAITARPPQRSAGAEIDRRVTAGLRWLARQPGVVRVMLFVSILNMVGVDAEAAVMGSLRQHGSSSAAIGAVLACAGRRHQARPARPRPGAARHARPRDHRPGDGQHRPHVGRPRSGRRSARGGRPTSNVAAAGAALRTRHERHGVTDGARQVRRDRGISAGRQASAGRLRGGGVRGSERGSGHEKPCVKPLLVDHGCGGAGGLGVCSGRRGCGLASSARSHKARHERGSGWCDGVVVEIPDSRFGVVVLVTNPAQYQRYAQSPDRAVASGDMYAAGAARNTSTLNPDAFTRICDVIVRKI